LLDPDSSNGTLHLMSVPFRTYLRQAVLLLLLATPLGLLTGLLHPLAPTWDETLMEPGEVRVETAREWQDVLWLDARSRRDYEESHIEGAMLLNEDEWEALFEDFMSNWSPGRKVVIYCGGSQCQASHAVAERLRKDLGGGEIHVLKGGWSEWNREAKQ
jgi:rhodanese-related sulfurtransferase